MRLLTENCTCPSSPMRINQLVCVTVSALLAAWSKRSGAGRTFIAPGLIFGEDDDVAPDIVWISNARLAAVLEPDGKFHAAPELVIEVLSPGRANERRDREVKLELYSRTGVQEYWIPDWPNRNVEAYRRVDGQLRLVATLHEGDLLETSLLPAFACKVADLFEGIPSEGVPSD